MKNIVRVLLIISLFSIPYSIFNKTFAQTDKTAGELDAAAAQKSFVHGNELMHKENYKGAIEAYSDAVDLDSSKANYQFQLGLAHYFAKNYKITISVLHSLLKKFPADERYYSLMGSCYTETRNDKKAYSVLQEGLKKYPNSGNIHSQLGKIEYDHKNFNLAINFWENGVQADPMYPSNYYYLSLAYGSTKEKMWGIIYGEIFINLETNTERTYEIMKRVYDFYQQAIFIKSPKNKFALFSDEVSRLSNEQIRDTMLLHKNFSISFNDISQRSLIVFKDKYNTQKLIEFRKRVIDLWYSKNRPLDFPIPIFDYQREIISEGYFEAYNYWLFSKGDPKAFNDWLEINKKKYDEFIKWFLKHPFEVYQNNFVTRKKLIIQMQ
jgi:tetratricopeptide (TPR) repeat protein